MRNQDTKVLKLAAQIIFRYLFIPIALLLLVLIFVFRDNKYLEFELVMLGVLWYVISAFLHHHFDRSLTVAVTLEYILLATLILIVIGGFLL